LPAALLSVSDKTGLAAFARGLARLGYELYATGSTMKVIQDATVDVRPVSDLTGFAEMMDGRVKTLHPGVHAGILARRDRPEHMRALAEHGLREIDLVCVNLYPFVDTVLRPDVTFEEVVEQIDIGGPAMIRAAAKNHESVVVVVRPQRYPEVLAALSEGDLDERARRRLAAEAYAHTSAYDAWIAAYLRREGGNGFPAEISVTGLLAEPLKFGGVVAVNRPLDRATAELIVQIVTHVVVAPDVLDDARDVLARRKNMVVLAAPPVRDGLFDYDVRSVPGGLLVQEWDRARFDRAACRTVTRTEPNEEQWRQLGLAWTAVKHVKSNAIVLFKGDAAVGVGAGQMSRVEAVQLAVQRAGERSEGAVMASDAFFPFPDGLELAARAGITAVIQPGGSVKDSDVIAAADAAGVAMVVTGRRHFKH
jgi:AICAR transformylase/IMP cyclohydrolase PurH